MSITPTGVLSEPVSVLCTMIAQTTAWDTWTEASDRVYPFAAAGRGDDAPERPYAIVFVPEGFEMGIQTGAWGRGVLHVLIEADVDTDNADSYADASYDFLNNVGALLSELMEDSGADGNLYIQRIQVIRQACRSNRDEARDDGFEDYMQVMFSVEYGVR